MYYYWEQFDEDAKKIAAWIGKNNIKNIYGVKRGGLVLAIKLSYLLDKPLAILIDEIEERTLVVDDICDSGRTLLRLNSKVPMFRLLTATLFAINNDLYTPSFSVHKKRKRGSFIIFPWETKKTAKIDYEI